MGNPTLILNGDQIYTDELIRENARLTIQHTADHKQILALSEHVEALEAEKARLSDQLESYETDLKDSAGAASQVRDLNAMLAKAIKDLHFVMAGGDPCQVCSRKCLMGTGDCKPIWRGEKPEEEQTENELET